MKNVWCVVINGFLITYISLHVQDIASFICLQGCYIVGNKAVHFRIKDNFSAQRQEIKSTSLSSPRGYIFVYCLTS